MVPGALIRVIEYTKEDKKKGPYTHKTLARTVCTFVRNQLEEEHQRTYKTSGVLVWKIFSREGKQPGSAVLLQSVHRRPRQR